MAKSPFSNWYGYDKKLPKIEQRYTTSDLGIPSTYYSSSRKVDVSEKAFRYIRENFDRDERLKMANLYVQPSDGYTDDDFIAFLQSDFKRAETDYLNWRSVKAMDASGLNREKGKIDWSVRSVYSSFFEAGKTRNDRIFRVIEINEFLNHIQSEDLTLSEFLTTNTELEDKCKNLIFTQYDSTTSELFFNYYLPQFLQFPNKVTQKTKDLLLPLTKDQMLKVFDPQSNPYLNTNSSDSHSFEYAKLYIAAALGEIEEAPVKELTPEEISNAIIISLLSKSEYWNRVADNRRASGLVSNIIEELDKISYNVDSFKRNFSYLISLDILKNLDAKEIVGLVLGYEKCHRWAEESKGKSTLENVMEMMQDGTLDPLTLAKLIAYIVNNHKDPIVIEPDFDWSLLVEAPPSWAYEMIPHSAKGKRLKPAFLSEIMKHY